MNKNFKNHRAFCMLIMLCIVNTLCFSQSREKLLEKANKGNADAQYEYGSNYCGKDTLQKLSWWKKAATQGHSQAILNLGIYYERKKQYEDAVFWFEKSHSGFAWSALGKMYQKGLGVKKDFEKAAYNYEKYLSNAKSASKKNGWLYDARSEMLNLALCYDSLGVYEDALKWYQEICYGEYDRDMQKSNEWDCASAVVGMIRLYYLGLGVEKDMKVVDKLWLELYGSYPKYAQNMLYYASDYVRNPHTPQDNAMVLFWIEKAVKYGSAEAVYMKGNAYEKGRYGVPVNMEKAVELYKIAAKKGDANASGRLGVLCYDGTEAAGLSQLVNSDAAFAFLLMATSKGTRDPEVAERLSCCYRDGYGTEINPKEQEYWESKARDWGSKKDWLWTEIDKKKKEERERLEK